MQSLSPRQRRTIELICETLVPAIKCDETQMPASAADFWKHSAENSGAAENFARRLEAASEVEYKKAVSLLNLIERPFACYVATGFFRPFRSLNLEERVRVLQKWNQHRNDGLRKFFQSIKRLTLFLTYAKTEEGVKHPAWEHIGYKGVNPLPVPITQETIQPFSIGRQNDLECETLIIGSGAGGSVMASELSQQGSDCLIAEKASWLDRNELGAGEYWGNRTLFEKHGSLSSDDLAVVILSGSAIGGGTTVNWMTCLNPTQQVLEQWTDEFGFHDATNGNLANSFQQVRDRLGVNVEQTVDNRQNAVLRRGCEKLGHSHETIARNGQGCGDCGFCGYGCRKPGKQDTRTNFLMDALENGTRIVPGLEIEKINIANGVANSAEARIRLDDNQVRKISIRFKRAVCCGGSIQTASLLLRSGLNHPHLGQNLFLHPTTALVAFYDEEITPWSGQPQTVVCDQFSDLDGNGYGVRFETAPLHPGFGGFALAWQDPQQHKKLMEKMRHMANTIILCRDKFGGRVEIDQSGRTVVKYSLGNQEAKHLLQGAAEVAKIHQAAGAHTIIGPHQEIAYWTRMEQTRSWMAGSLDNIDDLSSRIRELGARPNHLSLFSAHQMSTCRIASDPARGCANVEGRINGVENLYVADGSALPTSSGVNPMISIMGVAHLLAQKLKAKI